MKVTVYTDSRFEYRWRLRARNGRIIATSGEGYKARSGVLRSLRRMHTASTADATTFAEAFAEAIAEMDAKPR